MKVDAEKLDATKIEPHQRKHQVIFEKYDSLKSGGAFILHNDHDPLPLFYQLKSLHGETFDWEYFEKGPDVFEILITKH